MLLLLNMMHLLNVLYDALIIKYDALIIKNSKYNIPQSMNFIVVVAPEWRENSLGTSLSSCMLIVLC
jgi:hypothetical protein